jgi:hypothetical protein
MILAVAAMTVFVDRGAGIVYGVYSLVLLVAQSPWRQRRKRTHAEAALTANS